MTNSTLHNNFVVMMPPLVQIDPSLPWLFLPPGVHAVTLQEIEAAFTWNLHREALFWGLVMALKALKAAGCKIVFLNGSFVTSKEHPNDYDACWDPTGVLLLVLDPVLLTFDPNRASQKAKFKGEFFPSTSSADGALIYEEFFQNEPTTGKRKGILRIDLSLEATI